MTVMNVIISSVVSDVLSDLNTDITHVAYGDDNTTPDPTDTTLGNETYRNAKFSSITTTDEIRVIGNLSTSENNTTNAEVGVFDAASSGNMYMRNLLNSYIKTSSNQANYIIIGKIEVTQ